MNHLKTWKKMIMICQSAKIQIASSQNNYHLKTNKNSKYKLECNQTLRLNATIFSLELKTYVFK